MKIAFKLMCLGLLLVAGWSAIYFYRRLLTTNSRAQDVRLAHALVSYSNAHQNEMPKSWGEFVSWHNTNGESSPFHLSDLEKHFVLKDGVISPKGSKSDADVELLNTLLQRWLTPITNNASGKVDGSQ